MSKLTIFRGLPGSGKSTEANKLGTLVLSPSDMYSMRDGKYQWCQEYQERSKEWCLEILEFCFMHEMDITIAEVLPTIKSVMKYVTPALAKGYNIEVIDLECTIEESLKRNIHNVPIEHIEGMAKAFEPWNIEINKAMSIGE